MKSFIRPGNRKRILAFPIVCLMAVTPLLLLAANTSAHAQSFGADLSLRILPPPGVVHPGDLITYTFYVQNLGPGYAKHEVLNTQVPAGT